MPATVVSSSMGWGTYLASALILGTVLVPIANHVYDASQAGAASRTVAGVLGVLDGLRPGLIVSLSYGVPGEKVSIRMAGHLLSYDIGGKTAQAWCRWDLPHFTLLPGQRYTVWLNGASVEVS
ncbi:MAG: hypothetical protein OK404_01250 [Thaumarchaeota archaeon]|nr:hypothetical protein [Nitrososphaerota archaeon]